MLISEIKSDCNIYIAILKDGDIYKVKIDTISQCFKNQSLIDSVLCFKNSKVNIDGKMEAISWPDSLTYRLCVEHDGILSYWNNIKIKPLKGDVGFAAIVNSKESIDEKLSTREPINTSAAIKYIVAISIFTIVSVALLLHAMYKKDVQTSYSPYAGACQIEHDIKNEKVSESLPEDVSGDASALDVVDNGENIDEIESESYYTLTQTTYEGKNISYIVLDCAHYTPKLAVSDSKSSVTSLVSENGGTIGINASVITDDGELDLTYVNDTWISEKYDAYVGDPLIFTNNNLSTIGYNYVDISLIKKSNPTWVVTGYNAVIFNKYGLNMESEDEYNRSFIGQLSDGDYVIGVIENATYQDMIDWARSLFGYNINILYNLNSGKNCDLVAGDSILYQGSDVRTAIIF